MACDHNATASSPLLCIDTILNTETSSFDSIGQDCRILVITDTANVDDGVWWEYVLGAAGGVLCGTTSYELGIIVIEKVLVETKVLFFSEDCIICFEAIFFEKSGITNALDV